jgi:hypothetical protein
MLRHLPRFCLLALVAAAPFTVRAASVRVAAGKAEVVAVQPAHAADLVLLSSGFDAGLRQGMVCRVTRGAATIGEVLLVGLRSNCSAALILNLAPGQSIHAGDVAAIKVLKT